MEIKVLDHDAVLDMLPERDPDGHKGTFGKILLICGSRGYTGAAALAAMGALRSGAGLVYLAVPESIYTIEAVKLTEPVILPMADENGMLSANAAETLLPLLLKMDAILIGPGIGIGEGTRKILQTVLHEAKCPVVVDADGITLLAAHKDILRGRTGLTVLTPHMGEFMRLGGGDSGDRRIEAAEMARDLHQIVLLKVGGRQDILGVFHKGHLVIEVRQIGKACLDDFRRMPDIAADYQNLCHMRIPFCWM